MIRFKYIKSLLLALLCAVVLTTSNICTEKVVAEPVATPAVVNTSPAIGIKPLDVVANPKAYLNKVITMNAKFDKFSTLGLDYKSAFRSSEDYITFLIKRDDTSYDIPLSEMKLFILRDEAEKHIDLKLNDEIKIQGVVFSDALGDAWIDVKSLELIKKAPEKKDGV